MGRRTAGRNRGNITPRVSSPNYFLPELPNKPNIEILDLKFQDLMKAEQKSALDDDPLGDNVKSDVNISELIASLKRNNTMLREDCDDQIKKLDSIPEADTEVSNNKKDQLFKDLEFKKRELDISLLKSKNKMCELEREMTQVLELKKNFQAPAIPILPIEILDQTPTKPERKPVTINRTLSRTAITKAPIAKPQTPIKQTLRRTVSLAQNRPVPAK